jgi:hypothetical protein
MDVRCLPALVMLVLPATLLGCGGGGDDDPPAARGSGSASVPAAVTPTPTPTPTATPEAITTHVKDCFDAICRLKVTRPVRVPLDFKKFHYSSFKIVAIGPDSLTYRVDTPRDGELGSTLGVGGSGGFSFRSDPEVSLRLESAHKGVAVLAITQGKPNN